MTVDYLNGRWVDVRELQEPKYLPLRRDRFGRWSFRNWAPPKCYNARHVTITMHGLELAWREA